LLAVTGMRLGEAIGLDRDDVCCATPRLPMMASLKMPTW
jgi:hypothetical protein